MESPLSSNRGLASSQDMEREDSFSAQGRGRSSSYGKIFVAGFLGVVGLAVGLFVMADQSLRDEVTHHLPEFLQPAESESSALLIPTAKSRSQKSGLSSAHKTLSPLPKDEFKVPTKTNVSELFALYGGLPNPREGLSSADPTWTKEDEKLWSSKILHEKSWQRYEGVRELQQSRFSGGADLLKSALNDKKLWVRMGALCALADLGVDLPASLLEMVFQAPASERLANYFQKFYFRSTVGQNFVMRAALSYGKEDVRLVVLRVLAHGARKDPVNRPFFEAAKKDPSSKIRTWASSFL